MGVVYLAEQASLRRLVALKVIRHGINASQEELARFGAEAEAVARLQHPNIVQIHEVGGQDGVNYLGLQIRERRQFRSADRGYSTGATGSGPADRNAGSCRPSCPRRVSCTART